MIVTFLWYAWTMGVMVGACSIPTRVHYVWEKIDSRGLRTWRGIKHIRSHWITSRATASFRPPRKWPADWGFKPLTFLVADTWPTWPPPALLMNPVDHRYGWCTCRFTCLWLSVTFLDHPDSTSANHWTFRNPWVRRSMCLSHYLSDV